MLGGLRSGSLRVPRTPAPPPPPDKPHTILPHIIEREKGKRGSNSLKISEGNHTVFYSSHLKQRSHGAEIKRGLCAIDQQRYNNLMRLKIIRIWLNVGASRACKIHSHMLRTRLFTAMELLFAK